MSAGIVAEATPRTEHASEQDYEAFLRSEPGISGGMALKVRRQFVRAYPDLSAWLSAPLVERVGAIAPRRGPACMRARARPYLYFLVLEQRLRLDWPWILAINFHELPPKLLPSPVNVYIDTLAAKAIRLGYGPASRNRLRRVIKYLHLRNPGHAHMPSVAALAEFEQALTAFGDHPARGSFYASDNDWRKALAAHRTRAVHAADGALPRACHRLSPAPATE